MHDAISKEGLLGNKHRHTILIYLAPARLSRPHIKTKFTQGPTSLFISSRKDEDGLRAEIHLPKTGQNTPAIYHCPYDGTETSLSDPFPLAAIYEY